MRSEMPTTCEQCEAPEARSYELFSFGMMGETVEPQTFWLCAKCARARRQQIKAHPTLPDQPARQISRAEFITALDHFWGTSGAAEICGRCHAQGTGCCPPMCRYLSAQGCQKKNVFCTGFVCSALLNAIAECDPDTARLLKWVKTNVGAAEFRLYEMVTRVPAIDREPMRPLTLPEKYPGPLPLLGAKIKTKLLALADEILLLRQTWSRAEKQNILPLPESDA